MKKKLWITNHPKSIQGFWPRRTCEYFEGLPQKTYKYSVEEFIEMGYIGIYVNMTREEYEKYPLVANPKQFKEKIDE